MKIFTVPDSTTSSFLKPRKEDLIITSCEGEAATRATVWALESGQTAVLAIQNSGLGNAINPLTSFTSLYRSRISMKIVIGWRGAPGVKDEVQHGVMGAITPVLLETLDIAYAVPDTEAEFADRMEEEVKTGEIKAILVRPGLLSSADDGETSVASRKIALDSDEVFAEILRHKDMFDRFVLSTGYNGRQFYSHSGMEAAYLNTDDRSVIYNVGAMGFSYAMGLELHGQGLRTLVVDGDGSALMHFGSYVKDEHLRPKCLVLFNGQHESVGGFDLPFQSMETMIAHIPNAVQITGLDELAAFLRGEGRIGIVPTAPRSNKKLKRPL
ncbi:MAG: hypothetical protein HQL35_10125 [Alphaproteobacteria bacterium]|nr:hypothetical protein [Alphaproteobacteria bacterium]